jgi:tetratricopeptide (TPR) repeat protein
MADGTTTAAPRRRARRAPAPTTPDPIEIAMEAEAAGVPPTGVAGALLADQRLLIAADLKHRSWQIASERAGFALKVLTGLAGLTGAVALGYMAWQASRANGVVVEPFGVSPELAGQVTGQAVASQVLDELTKLKIETERGSADDPSYSSRDEQEIKVAIPGSGVNLGDLQAALRTWLGHETRVSGEVFRTPNGLAIRARLPGGEAVRAEGPATELEELSRQTADGIYRQTQPLRYADWLARHGNMQSAFALFRQVAQGAGPEKARAQSYHTWGFWLQQTDITGAIALQHRALALDPRTGVRWSQLGLYEGQLGHDELEVAYRKKGLELRRKQPERDLRPEVRGTDFDEATLASLEADFAAALAHAKTFDANRFWANILGAQVDALSARTLAALHDPAAARDRLAAPQFPGGPQPERTLSAARVWMLARSDEWPAIVAQEPQFEAMGTFGPPNRRAWNMPWLITVLAHAQTGDEVGARSRLPVPPADCARCVYTTGRIHAALGDTAASERSFAQAASLLKTLPQAHFYWGKARLERGDAAGALPLLREAERRQPHWADPFRMEGDALGRLGRWAEAEKAYAKAEPLAPRWGGLHLMHGVALAKLGKLDAARAQWSTAARLYLTRGELSLLEALTKAA